MFSDIDRFMVCCFEGDTDLNDLRHIQFQSLQKGEWTSLFIDSIFVSSKSREEILLFISNIKTKEDDYFYKILSCGIASMFAFCEANWCGPSSKKAEQMVNTDLCHIYDGVELTEDGEECYPTIIHTSLLCLAMDVFDNLGNELIVVWWRLRCYFLYQQMLDENSVRVLSVIENTLQLLSNMESDLRDRPDLQTLLNIEMSQAYLLYGRVENSEICIQKASKICGLTLQLKGALGKRTKFQQTAVPQLGLDVTISDIYNRIPAHVTHGSTVLPSPLNLNDDLRLEDIEYLDIKERFNPSITSLEQQLCLATVQQIQRSQPKDELANEELMPYLNLLLAQKNGPWSTRISVFIMKCRLESKNKRTVERSMMQCEQLVNSVSASEPSVGARLSYLWASALPPLLCWKSLLGDLLLSIGLVKAALDIYLELELWEEVIACYTILELRHKAAEIIQQQIEIKPTAKLYCLLGDATDDPSQYQKAWDFSNHKSSRAQRHWGNYLFSHKKYEECIPHYEKSCEINSLQESVWLRLGYAALMVEQWNIAANAYRRYTYLEPHSFEAWNNLAKAYVKQGNKERAYKALNETLKYNYNNWQVWENMLIISLDTGHFDDVIRGYNRILDLKKKHLDIQVLTLLVKVILEEKDDTDGNPSKRIYSKVLELFGRITSLHPTEPSIWQLYADISPNVLLKGQRLMKAFSATTSQNGSWVHDKILTDTIVNLTETLANCALQSVKEIESLNKAEVWQLVSSSRLTTQAVIRAVTNQQHDDFTHRINILQDFLQQLTTELQKR